MELVKKLEQRVPGAPASRATFRIVSRFSLSLSLSLFSRRASCSCSDVASLAKLRYSLSKWDTSVEEAHLPSRVYVRSHAPSLPFFSREFEGIIGVDDELTGQIKWDREGKLLSRRRCAAPRRSRSLQMHELVSSISLFLALYSIDCTRPSRAASARVAQMEHYSQLRLLFTCVICDFAQRANVAQVITSETILGVIACPHRPFLSIIHGDTMLFALEARSSIITQAELALHFRAFCIDPSTSTSTLLSTRDATFFQSNLRGFVLSKNNVAANELNQRDTLRK